VDACDVLVGAHGAGLTNMVFLRAGAVVVQVIPWGKMEPYGEGFVGAPAAHMGLRHVAYNIAAEEEHAVRQVRQGPPGDHQPRRVLQERQQREVLLAGAEHPAQHHQVRADAADGEADAARVTLLHMLTLNALSTLHTHHYICSFVPQNILVIYLLKNVWILSTPLFR